MKVALAQMSVKQRGYDENLAHAREFAERAAENGADLVVFPEMFLSGFHYAENKKVLEGGRNFATELSCIARDAHIAICGSVCYLERLGETPSNRMLLIDSHGKLLAHYDKIHLFSVFNEHKHVKGGERIVVCDSPFGKIGLSICYDLRFPEMYVRMAQRGAQLIIVSTAWPHPRMGQLKILARARAIDTQAFLICVNQAGVENFGSNSVNYCGSSCLVSPTGETLAECKQDVEDMQFCEINLKDADKIREKIPALRDRRPACYF